MPHTRPRPPPATAGPPQTPLSLPRLPSTDSPKPREAHASSALKIPPAARPAAPAAPAAPTAPAALLASAPAASPSASAFASASSSASTSASARRHPSTSQTAISSASGTWFARRRSTAAFRADAAIERRDGGGHPRTVRVAIPICLDALAHGSADAAEAIHAELGGEGGEAPSLPTRPLRLPFTFTPRIPSLTPTSSRDPHASAGAVPRSSSNAAIPCRPSGASRACRASAHPSHMTRSVAQASIATATGARSLVSTSARPPTSRSVCCDAQSPVAQPRTAARAWHATRWLGASTHD